jgi:DNA-directed RNA polymerase I subunit RPA12
MSNTGLFRVNDLEFCSNCGTILPLPTFQDSLICKLCKTSTNIREWNGKIIENNYLINQINRMTHKEGLKKDDFSGTLVDRKCSKCSHEGMTYSTRQTRSADEGQTVFFACPRCK